MSVQHDNPNSHKNHGRAIVPAFWEECTMYDDEPHDYGFDQPDQREEWILKDGSRLELWIVRRYHRAVYQIIDEDTGEVVDFDESDELDYSVSFRLVKFAKDERGTGKLIIHFPEGKDESTCSEVVGLLYADEIDDEETDEAREYERERQYEIRMGL